MDTQNDNSSDRLSELTERILRFRQERDWAQFHNAKDLAISLSLEVAELLELMQWKNGDDLTEALILKKQEFGEELSDILYWTLLIAHDLKIDLVAAFMQKMTVNESKYPVAQARGSKNKYNEIS